MIKSANKRAIFCSLIVLLFASGADASSGGNGSGNPKNDASWNETQPIALFVWRDGELISNPEREPSRKELVEVMLPAHK